MQEAPLSDERTIPRLVRAAAARYSDRSAIEDGPVTLSFAELGEASLAAARAFLASGVEPGDRIGLWAPNIAEWVVSAIGVQMAGAVLVPLSTRFKRAEAGYVLRKSGAKLLCTVGDFLGTNYADSLEGEDLPALEAVICLRGGSKAGIPWREFLDRGESVSRDAARERSDAVSPDDLSDLLFTSGTTGKPKGVMATHAQSLKVFDVWSDVVGLREGDRYLIVNPFFHTFGYKAGWLSCILRGATAIPHAVFDVGEVLKRVESERISVLPGPPTLYQSILAHPDRPKYDLSCLRLAVTGAAAVPVEMIHRMRDELGFETIVTAYGLTECTGMVSICRPDDDPEIVATTSGRAIPDVEVRCIDPDGAPVPAGEPGEVVVRGYNVMKGYYEDASETRATIDEDGWLHTGDIAVMDAQGNLRITDRIKDMYIAGGFNCYPAEIENLMFAHPDIAQVAVIGIPDERMGEVGMAFVVPVAGKALDSDAIIAWCRDQMSNYKVPRRVEVIEELPMNASGKVMKFQLRELALGDS